MPGDRVIRLRAHDDGINAWLMADIAPHPALAPTIRAYCDYSETTGGFTARRELPHAEGVLIVNLGEAVSITGGDGRDIELGAGEAFVAGVHLRPAISRSSGAQAGVHVFLPLESLRRLLAVPMDELVDRAIPLDAIFGAQARALGQRLVDARSVEERSEVLDRALLERIGRAAPACRQQAHALHLLRTRRELDIAEVARTIGWSRKHLAHKVRDAVGVGPRSFRRLLRFQNLVAALDGDPSPDWAGLAHEHGYCDQPHLVREFREFAELTPGQFAARRLAGGGGVVEA